MLVHILPITKVDRYIFLYYKFYKSFTHNIYIHYTARFLLLLIKFQNYGHWL